MEEVKELLTFIEKSKTMYHVAYEISKVLRENGFMELNEGEMYNLKQNGKYFIIRNDASLIAFKMPSKEKANSFKIVASHLDSPTFKIKPNNTMTKVNYQLLNTEVYGGAILSTWFDRPLGIAGRVFINSDNGIETKLVDLDSTFVIPNIAIHLNRDVNNGYQYNPQVDTLPLYGNKDSESLNTKVAKTLNIKEEDILSNDLYIYSKEKGTIVGIDNEYFISPKIDNLECAYTSLKAFIKASSEEDVLVYASFNHEEVGSSSNHGANSTFLDDTLRRIANSYDQNYEFYLMLLAKSMIVSADNAHAIHPAAPEKSDPTNYVLMNEGIVIKNACNLSYTTDGASAAKFIKILKDNKVKYQQYTNRSNMRGGGTLGSISLSHVSISSVDIGLAQLAMHSAVETAGTEDVKIMIDGLTAFYNNK